MTVSCNYTISMRVIALHAIASHWIAQLNISNPAINEVNQSLRVRCQVQEKTTQHRTSQTRSLYNFVLYTSAQLTILGAFW